LEVIVELLKLRKGLWASCERCRGKVGKTLGARLINSVSGSASYGLAGTVKVKGVAASWH
jgi:hypothetical protein